MFMVYSITGAVLNVNNNRNGFRISNLTIKQPITTTKNYLKYYNIVMSPWRFKIKVNPRIIRLGKEPLTKDCIVKILETCSGLN